MSELGDIREDIGAVKQIIKNDSQRLERVEKLAQENSDFKVKVVAWASTAAAAGGILLPWIAKFVLAILQAPRPH